MSDSNNSPKIKLIATCLECGEPVGVSDGRDESLCAKCFADKMLDAETQTEFESASEGQLQSQSPSASESPSPSPSPSPSQPLHDDDVPGNYQILELIPTCLHGKAFIVHDKHVDARFLLRFVSIGVARLTGGLPIETVANLLVQQNHPHLSAVYDWQNHNSKNYLILDPPPPKNLETIIQNEGFLDLPRAIDVFIQVCEALEELHKISVVHGHIRPRSIGVVEQSKTVDTVKVTNFSITSVSSNNIEQPLKISRNYTCNDVFYMSPEELRGDIPSISSDIYSLGCVIFHSITGKPVYRGRTVDEVRNLHLDPKPAEFRRRYEIPPNVEQVVIKMLEHDPAMRYRTIRGVRRDLERLRDNKAPLLEDKWKTWMTFLGQ